MSGFASPLWLLGIGRPNPSVSARAGAVIGGMAFALAAMPASGGVRLEQAALGTSAACSGRLTSLPAAPSGSSGALSAKPGMAGAMYND